MPDYLTFASSGATYFGGTQFGSVAPSASGTATLSSGYGALVNSLTMPGTTLTIGLGVLTRTVTGASSSLSVGVGGAAAYASGVFLSASVSGVTYGGAVPTITVSASTFPSSSFSPQVSTLTNSGSGYYRTFGSG